MEVDWSTTPSLSILRKRDSGEFGVVDFAINRSNGFCVAVGKIRWFDNTVFRDQCVAIILESLSGFSARELAPSELSQLSTREYKDFRSRVDEIAIDSTGIINQVTLTPMRLAKKGSVGSPEEATVLMFPCTSDKLFNLLMSLFAPVEGPELMRSVGAQRIENTVGAQRIVNTRNRAKRTTALRANI